MKAVKRFAAVLVGSVFFFAGMLKLMDPVGTRLIVEEYLKFMHLRFLMFGSGIIASCVALLETLVGIALITGVWRRVTAMLSGIMIGFFTLLTLVLWIFDPPMDCGCFGEAIHLSHLQSLLKNVVLLLLWALAALPFGTLGKPLKIKYVSFWIAAVSVSLFMLYSQLSIPLFDFTPFKPGVELQQSEDVFIEGAPLLSFSDAAGDYADELAARGNVLVVSVYDPASVKPSRLAAIAELFDVASQAGVTPLLLLAGSSEELDEMGLEPMLMMNSFFADKRSLLTLNRSNGGATWISDGQIVTKWAGRSLPDSQKIAELISKDATASVVEENTPKRIRMQAVLLYISAVIFLL